MPKPEGHEPATVEDHGVSEIVGHILGSAEVARNYGYLGPGAVLADRFEVRGPLGMGGMGHVVSAFDRTLQTQVALKLLGRMTPGSILLVKNEFRTVAEIVHPNLVRLHELFCDRSEWFFAMDLVDGVSPKALGPIDTRSERFRRIFQQLACAIRVLHEAGVVHADLKPSNFLITRGDEQVVLLDFGLARPVGVNPRLRGGTPAYMAPEQALGLPLTEASDWYSFGVVLYEALTGTLPVPRPSPELLADAPADMSALCIDLLNLSHDERPPGELVLQRIGQLPSAPSFPTLPASSRQVFVGRGAELARLEEAFEQSLAGKPVWVLVEGPSGIGKTALVTRFLDGLRERGACVVAGDCRERESMGYKAIDGLIDGIISELDSLPYEAAATLLPDDVGDLTLLFPALRSATVVAEVPRVRTPEQSHGVLRVRAIAAFVELLRRLRARSPLVIWIDNAQWADEESSLLLSPMIGGPRPVPLLFIASARVDDGGAGPLMSALLGSAGGALPLPERLTIEQLTEGDATVLAEQLLQQDTASGALEPIDVIREAGGHPLFIAELVHASRTHGGDPPPATLAQLIEQRLGALPAAARALIETLAVGGAPLGRAVLREACGSSLADTEQSLALLRVSRLARTHGLRERDAIDVAHDRIREIIVHGLSDTERRFHHSLLARALEVAGGGKAELIASHYEAAGELEEASRHWLAAADRASAALAFAHAAELYEKVARSAGLDPAALSAIRRRWALSLANAGKGPAAADIYLLAATAAGEHTALELENQAAEQLLLAGHIEPGLALIDRVSAQLGMRITRGKAAAIIELLSCRFRLRLRGMQFARTPRELTRRELARLDTAWSMSCSLGVIDPIRGAGYQTRHLLEALAAGEPWRVLRALSVEAAYTAARGPGTERRTEWILRLANELVAKSESPVALGLVSMTSGIASYLQGRLTPALADLEQALEILARQSPGAVWEITTTRRFLVASLFFLGSWRKLNELVPTFLAEAEGTGNLYASMCYRVGYAWVAWVARDDLAEARRQIERARGEWKALSFQLCHCNILIAESHMDLYEGEAERGLERLERHWGELRATGLLRIGVLDVQMHHLRAALAVQVASISEKRNERHRVAALRRRAWRAIRRLLRSRLPRAAALGALSAAALDLAEGRRGRAVERLRAAVSGFERENMYLFAAAAQARLAPLVAGDERATLEARSGEHFQREAVACPDRVIEMLAPGFDSSAPVVL